MADQKVTQLTEDTTPAITDLLLTVDDPSGTPASKKATISNVVKAVNGATANTTPATADIIPIIDDPGGSPSTQKITLANLLKVVSGLTANTVPVSTDEALIMDDPGGTLAAQKITLANLLKVVNGLTANTTPVSTDEMLLMDDPAGTLASQKITLANLFKVINGLTEDTAPLSDDYLVSYDASASAAKKVKCGYVGRIVQIVATQSGAESHGTTVIPKDDTIPTSSEGDAIVALDTTITPTNTANILEIDVILQVSASAASYVAAALFQDAGAAAIAVCGAVVGAAYGQTLVIRYRMTAGTTSATTFKVRAGPEVGTTTLTINGQSSGRLFGGIFFSSVKVTEIAV